MIKQVKLGLIGCGWIIQKIHIPVFKSLQNVELLSVYDIKFENAEKVACDYEIRKAYIDLEPFFESGINTVIIATPNFTHVEYTKLALQRKLNVLCEKPVAMTKKEINEIVELAKKNDVVYMPGFVNRFRKDIWKFYDIYSGGKVGEIVTIEASWIRKAGIPKAGTWFTNKSMSGGGVLMDLGAHVIDICTMFIKNFETCDVHLKCIKDYNNNSNASWYGTNINVEKYQIDVEKTVMGSVSFKNDVNLKINLSWDENIINDYTYFRIWGTKGKMELKTLFGFSNQRLWSEEVIIIEKDSEVEKIVFEREDNNAYQAFNDMAVYFVNQIICGEGDYLIASNAVNSVSLIEKMYQNEEVFLEEEYLLFSERLLRE